MTKSQNEFPITDAGHRFLELYAEPVVTNTYLKVALLVLSAVTLASAGGTAMGSAICVSAVAGSIETSAVNR